jgi:hypothetical protein
VVPCAKILSCLTGFEPETASEWFVVRTRGGAVEHGQHVVDEFVVLKIKLYARHYLSLRHKSYTYISPCLQNIKLHILISLSPKHKILRIYPLVFKI